MLPVVARSVWAGLRGSAPWSLYRPSADGACPTHTTAADHALAAQDDARDALHRACGPAAAAGKTAFRACPVCCSGWQLFCLQLDVVSPACCSPQARRCCSPRAACRAARACGPHASTWSAWQLWDCLPRESSTRTPSQLSLTPTLRRQPETFDLFDEVILLSNGKVLYHGPREAVLPFFEVGAPVQLGAAAVAGADKRVHAGGGKAVL